jgi:hypothetical protein
VHLVNAPITASQKSVQQLDCWQRLSCLHFPVSVANDDSDPMISPPYSDLLAGLISQARVKIYPVAAHGLTAAAS